MEFMMINPSFDVHRLGEGAILDGITYERAAQKANLGITEILDWPRKCPMKTCGYDLHLTVDEHSVLTAWCPRCGWLPCDGYEARDKYITTKEAAKEFGFTPELWSELCKTEQVESMKLRCPSGQKWFINRLAAEWMVETGGYTLHPAKQAFGGGVVSGR